MEMLGNIGFGIVILVVIVIIGIIVMISRWYKKASQGQAIVRTGVGGTRVSFNGILIVPVLHRMETMDISLKAIQIERAGAAGLVCRDNIRADIKVAFFIRVNKTLEDVIQVAQSVGCIRSSDPAALNDLFDAKFSEALKTIGKKFDFVDLYNKRDEFREEIVNIIGTDLNGFILDDAAIDYLEQTPLSQMDESNILDAEGIKKIISITSREKIQSNQIERDRQKTIRKQDVEAQEAILELDKQLAEKEEKQKREIANIKSREEAEIAKVQQEETLKSERSRIITEEEIQISEQNKEREIIVASKNKERTSAVETERIEKDRLLEVTERERIVTLAQIAKEKAIETQKRDIQEVIRERVAIEKTVVDEEENIKDTRARALANREKLVAVTKAEESAEAALVEKIKAAEAANQAAEFTAKQVIIEAQAEEESSIKRAAAMKTMADAEAAREAAHGIAEAQVMEAKATARQKEGDAEAAVIEARAMAEAKEIQAKQHARAISDLEIGKAEAEVIEAKAVAEQKKGLAEAVVSKEKYDVEAEGIHKKADAMKKLDGVGKDHEEFKLRLDKEKSVELAQISIQKDIADAQAEVISNALKTAKIDIVGGEAVFFDKIISAISNGKSVERMIDNSGTLGQLKTQLLDGIDGSTLKEKIGSLVDQFGISSDDLKNLSVSALIFKMMQENSDDKQQGVLNSLLSAAKAAGIGEKTPHSLGIK
ncbi:flotillin family protein [Cryomorpha ignava]|uniref:Flotillin family protein n=2 Tax=Cryomorpha ignava TaxID=101383 RepID=A0A7K3WRL1_9FLAO|nr:flotillin family protein [Cryomorpha ignava]